MEIFKVKFPEHIYWVIFSYIIMRTLLAECLTAKLLSSVRILLVLDSGTMIRRTTVAGIARNYDGSNIRTAQAMQAQLKLT